MRVLKCGHHGSGNATSDAWRKAVHPRYAAISCGLHNVFGHPAPATLARLKAHGVTTFVTAFDGAAVFVGDGKTVTGEGTIKRGEVIWQRPTSISLVDIRGQLRIWYPR